MKTTTATLTGAIDILLIETGLDYTALLILKALCPTSSRGRAGAAPVCAVHEVVRATESRRGDKMSKEAGAVEQWQSERFPEGDIGLVERVTAQTFARYPTSACQADRYVKC